MKQVPQFVSRLRKNIVEVPEIIDQCSGIRIFGQLLKSFLFTTDVAIIRNTNADAIIAVYPFTPQSVISQALITAADKPVLCGVGGGITTGIRSIDLAMDAEFRGALGVILNKPTSNDLIKELRTKIDIPILVTIVSAHDDIKGRIDAGVDFLNVSGADKTPDIVKKIKDIDDRIGVIATGGKTEQTIEETIKAGADAISYTPPTSGELFKEIMRRYRDEM